MTIEERDQLNQLRIKEARERVEKEESEFRGRFKDYLFWCSEGCGFVSHNHRCEQWSSVTYVSPALVSAIRALATEPPALPQSRPMEG